MASLADFTSVFRVQLKAGDGSNTIESETEVVAKARTDGRVGLSDEASKMSKAHKARAVVSCTLCRARKKKCDRLQPCRTCKQRGLSGQCQYEGGGSGSSGNSGLGVSVSGAGTGPTWPSGRRNSSGGSGRLSRPTASMRQETQARLQRLEEMVHGMLARPGAPPAARMAAKEAGAGTGLEAVKAMQHRRKDSGDKVQAAGTDPMQAIRNQVPFTGVAPWAAVLESIRDIQSYLGHDNDNGSDGDNGSDNSDNSDCGIKAQPERPGARAAEAEAALAEAEAELEPDIIFATAAMVRPEQRADDAESMVAALSAELPAREECDRLLAAYFSAQFVVAPFLHEGQFRRASQRFWESKNGGPPQQAGPRLLWLSMLAAVLCIGARMSARGGDGRKERATATTLVSRLRRLSMRCLLAGDYLSGGPLAVEALLLNATLRLMERRDGDAALWTTFGVAARLAQRQGYHQVDAGDGGSNNGNSSRGLSAFDREMRRRAWYMVEAFDVLGSFQMGVPAVVHEDDVATALPHNLRDGDFDERSAVAALPPPRPASETTPALYYGLKLGLVRLLRRAMRAAGRPRGAPGAEAETTAIAADLHALHNGWPPGLRMPERIQDCPASDAQHDILHRLVLELMYHKCLCVLFRQALTAEEEDDGHGGQTERRAALQGERQTCLVSALRILDLHRDFDAESRSGRLTQDRQMATLAMHDFLLAATILCLGLAEDSRRGRGHLHVNENGGDENMAEDGNGYQEGHWPCLASASLRERVASRAAKLETLRAAHALWYERRRTSRDAAHASRILGAIVKKLSVAAEAGDGADKQARPCQRVVYDWDEPSAFDMLLDDPGSVDWNLVDAYLLDRPQYSDSAAPAWPADMLGLDT